MDESEARKTQKLADFYSQLLDIEEAFEMAQKEIETKFSIANNFDLENPDTYVKLIRPVSRKIQHIANNCKLARYILKEYRAMNSPISLRLPNLPKTIPKNKTSLSLEQRISRLEFLIYLLYCLLIGGVLGVIIPMLLS